MTETKESIRKGIKTGFVNATSPSEVQFQPRLLLNNKQSGKKVLSYILRELRTCNEFWFSVAFLTKGGLMALINALKSTDENNVSGKILVSQYLNFTQPQALRALLKFNNIETRIVTDRDFHSKGYLFKKLEHSQIVIGSSNITANALSANTELNIAFAAADGSQILNDVIEEFESEFEDSTLVNDEFIKVYQEIYDLTSRPKLENPFAGPQEENSSAKPSNTNFEVQDVQASFDHEDLNTPTKQITTAYKPNKMQINALTNLVSLREQGAAKALLISATGTGKTFLAAFDVQQLRTEKMLFVVHRKNIALKAKETFEKLFGTTRTYGVFSGRDKDTVSNFIFATVQTISKPENFQKFSSNHFDYIVLDETHRAGANSYQPIFDYFSPKFLLGMTATPERTDGYNIFEKFDHNIAHEIRLHDAMSENMLSPFHYFGISDLNINDERIDDVSLFNKLTSEARVEHIIEHIEFYGTDNDEVRGLVFCSRKEECNSLSDAFNKRGYKTIALSGSNSDEERIDAIKRLESSDKDLKIDYIFSVDIFNEGIDIPSLNQIVMLRPTQSAIVFVQQLGRGLRKNANKHYLTVIDFIGNYQSNYLVPVALYGDTSYSKDTLRKLMASGSSLIPGSSTINFDEITTNSIYNAIDQANLQTKKELVKDYKLLKYKIGRIPKMVDFLDYGSRDPQLYVEKSKSFFNFVANQEAELLNSISEEEKLLLELFAKEINNAKRIVETVILQQLLKSGNSSSDEIASILYDKYGVKFSHETISSAVNNLNFSFIRDKLNGQLVSLQKIYDIENVTTLDEQFEVGKTLENALKNPTFNSFLIDNIEYALKVFDQRFRKQKFIDGFNLYQKYSRKDVFRILNWSRNPVAQNVGGYKKSDDGTNCPIFVNYHKSDDISETTKYEDKFLNKSILQWMSKSRRKLESPDVQAIRNAKGKMRIPLFIKKSNDEGTEFYYMGELHPIAESFIQTTMPSGKSEDVSVVKVNFLVSPPIEDSIFDYVTSTI